MNEIEGVQMHVQLTKC